MQRAALVALSLSLALPASAEKSALNRPDMREKGYFLAGSQGFMFGDFKRQGDREAPGGIAMFSAHNIQFNFKESGLGVGLLYLYEAPLGVQTNKGYALKGEYDLSPFLIDFGVGTITQYFVDRSITRRDGTLLTTGFGLRIFVDDPLKFLQKVKSKLYFEGTGRLRLNIMSSEDGVAMSDKIYQYQMYPFLGMGVQY